MKRIGIGLILAFAIAGCTQQETGSPSATATRAATPLPTDPPSAGEPAGALCAEGHEPCPLEAGTYSAAPFEPGFTFTIHDAWQNDRAFADGGGISMGVGGIFWASGVSSGTVGGEEVEIGASAADFVTFLQSLAAIGVTVSEPQPASVGGVEGQQLDVETNDIDLPGLYLVEEDTFNLTADEKARFIVLDMDGEAIILIIDSYAAAGFDDWLETAEPVVESIAWD